MKLGIPKERRSGERRVAASPETIKKYVDLGFEVMVEKGAGAGAKLRDEDFEKAGASISDDLASIYGCDLVLKVQRPEDEELEHLHDGLMLVGALDPYNSRDQIKRLADSKVSSFALELLPRTTRAQTMDILSSQANLAGYKAVVDAVGRYNRVLPMMMTAAGTVTPAKVFIVGAGVAGLQAIATARRMGGVVSATDVRPAAKGEVESLGAKFVGVTKGDGEGGYARELDEEEQKEQAQMVAEHIKGQDIVVTTAQIPGRKAPRIISGEMVASMKEGSVIVDLAAESGGNVEGSKPGEVVETDNGVLIIGAQNTPSTIAPAATTLYAKNLQNFVQLLVKKGEGEDAKAELVVDTEDDLVEGTLVTHEGRIVHPKLQDSES